MKNITQYNFFGKPPFNQGGVVIPDHPIKFLVNDLSTGHCINNEVKWAIHEQIAKQHGGWDVLRGIYEANNQSIPCVKGITGITCLFLDATDFERYVREGNFEDDPQDKCQSKTKEYKALQNVTKLISPQFKTKFAQIYNLHNPNARPIIEYKNSEIANSLGMIDQSISYDNFANPSVTAITPTPKKKELKTTSDSVSNSEIATKVSKIFKSHNLTPDRIEKVLKIVELDSE